MMTTSGSGRIVKRKLKNGEISFIFSVCRHVRIMGRPNHTQLALIGSFRQSEFSARAEEFWSIVDEKLSELVKTNRLWKNDADKVRKQFNAVIPRPAPVAKKTDETSLESNAEIMKSVIAELAERAERKLAEEGRY